MVPLKPVGPDPAGFWSWGRRPITPGRVTVLEPNQIFVFGSNYAGRHGRGAALDAVKFGAIRGQGTGLMGQSYGIATKDHQLKVLSPAVIGAQVDEFLAFVEGHPELYFLVTAIGCGLANYTANDIAPLFYRWRLPYNMSMPLPFVEWLNHRRDG